MEIFNKILDQSLIMALIMLLLMVAFYLFLAKQRARKRYSPFTEDILRVPAQRLEKDIDDLQDKLWFGVLLTLLVPAMLLTAQNRNKFHWVLATLFFVPGITYVLRVLQKAIRLRLAADGELYTGLELNYLMRSGALVYHDIPYQYGNIDHIVVSTGGVFTVETKSFRKPEGKRKSSRDAKMMFDGMTLKFPHFETAEPVEQARRHAKHIQQCIKRNLGLSVYVTPVVALPGWFIDRTDRSDVWVINPKRGGALAKTVSRTLISPQQFELIANYIESVARSVPAGSKKMDPDASKNYDFWNNPRYKPPSIG